jgi:hypothetical protein
MPLSPGYSLEYGCTTIADPNRVAQYVSNAQDPDFCVAGQNRLAPLPFALTNLRVNCGCPALQFSSPAPGEDPVLIPPYTTPEDDLAPWYSPNDPSSAFFYGFMVEKIEDLHTAPVKREVTNRVSAFGGATLGSLRRQPRVIKVTVLGFGNNESALNYGFRWLTDTLTYQCVGDDCSLCDLTIRTECPELSAEPTYEEWDQGRWTFREVGLVDGPRMVDPPIEAAACNVRRYEFTLAASSPYAYKCPVTCIAPTVFIPAIPPCPPEDWICGPDSQPSQCCYVTNSSALGDTGLLIDIQSVQQLSNIRIKITPDPFGYVCGLNPAPPGYAYQAATDSSWTRLPRRSVSPYQVALRGMVRPSWTPKTGTLRASRRSVVVHSACASPSIGAALRRTTAPYPSPRCTES